MTQSEKWAKELSDKCDVSDRYLKLALEELTETCGADAPTAKKIIEELTMSCHTDKDELMRFIKQVSKNCPVDIEKLADDVSHSDGDYARAYNAIGEAQTKSVAEKQGSAR